VLPSSESIRVATLFRAARIRIREREINDIGRVEYVIAVCPADIALAEQVFRADAGNGRTFHSSEKS
jgi:hypothetical protein